MGIVDSILKALGMGGKEPPAAIRDAERRAAEIAAETQRKAAEAATEVRRQAEAAAEELRKKAGEAAEAASRKLQDAADALETKAGQAGGVAAEMARHAAGAARTAATNIEAAAGAIEDRLEAAAEAMEDRAEALAEMAEAKVREIAAPAIAAASSVLAGGRQAAPGAAQTAGATSAGETHLEGRKCMSKVSMTVNGRRVEREVEDRTLLVQFLREDLNLTGTHVGCDTSQCGACVVHVDGVAVKSCTILAAQASGASVVTIEGLAKDGALHPVQEAFREHHGLQCGFCTPGMIMTAVDMIERAKKNGVTLDEATIRHELEGNICRCTGYHNIVRAIESAAAAA